MKNRKQFKVVMLPTEKDSYIHKNESEVFLLPNKVYYTTDSKPQHLYIISDEEIEEGDWCFDLEVNRIFKAEWGNPHNSKKIVATTDKSLQNINGNVNEENERDETGLLLTQTLPQIPESFVLAYIKAYNEDNPITEVDLETICEYGDNCPSKGAYDKQHLCKISIKTRPDNTVIVHQSKMYSREEVEKLLRIAFNDSCKYSDFNDFKEQNL